MLKLSDQSIARWLHSAEHQGFFILHGLYCTAHIDLYHSSIPGLREGKSPDLPEKMPRDFVLKSRKQVTAHAITLARFWETAYSDVETILNGKAILLGNYNIAESVQLCTRAFITASRNKLYVISRSKHP